MNRHYLTVKVFVFTIEYLLYIRAQRGYPVTTFLVSYQIYRVLLFNSNLYFFPFISSLFQGVVFSALFRLGRQYYTVYKRIITFLSPGEDLCVLFHVQIFLCLAVILKCFIFFLPLFIHSES